VIYACCDERRRSVLAAQTAYNGIDYLEVVDDPSTSDDQRQRTLRVYFILPLAPDQLTIQNVTISGGESITNVAPIYVYEDGFTSPPGDPLCLVVQVNGPGDFSQYTLSIVDTADPTKPPPGIDFVLSSICFTFKVACPSTLDCQPVQNCPPNTAAPIDISYLAKDFKSFLGLMQDRMAATLPQWQETHPADLGQMLLEVLAFIGDYLSYQQDAVATEAYLSTARRRTSVRRHVRLIDYPMHDGRNARTWAHFNVRSDVEGLNVDAGTTQLLTPGSQPGPILAFSSSAYAQAISEGPQVFELMEGATLYAEHNQICFYTWGDRECCLPAGATSAWLRGSLPNLAQGNVLIFMEAKGPNTGQASDADPAHRWAVRLTSVSRVQDPIGGQFDDPPNSNPVDVTGIEWAAGDALPFALCLSNMYGASYYDGVSVALGNNALADNGRTIAAEALPPVPAPNPALTIAQPSGNNRCAHPAPVTPKPPRYNPSLAQAPLTFADPYDPTAAANAALNSCVVDGLLPSVSLTAEPGGDAWTVVADLLDAGPNDKLFVAEVENDGSATLRFGDSQYGMAPVTDTVFEASYRVGNGTAGNIGANALALVATNNPALLSEPSSPVISSVTNPLPASGGIDPQPLSQVRQLAPIAFRTQERAVTGQDYGTMAVQVDPSLAQATGTFRWTGSWRTVFISADPEGTETLPAAEAGQIQTGIELYRMAGHDVAVVPPTYVSLELHMQVCVQPGYLASDVEQALLNVLSNRILPDGTVGAFYPDNFTFGQTIYLSPIYALVQNTAGVDSVNITRFQRQGQCATNAVSTGSLQMDRLEIARLDNDPNYPNHGILKLCVAGGQ
jgi:hypothetical protein